MLAKACGGLAGELTPPGQRTESVVIKAQGKDAGISARTPQRAAELLGVVIDSEGFPRRTYWSLPSRASGAPVAPVAETGATMAPLARLEEPRPDAQPPPPPTGTEISR
jgi:hypothetical protein